MTNRWRNAWIIVCFLVLRMMIGGCQVSNPLDNDTQENQDILATQAYWASFSVGSTEPQISDQSTSWYADLDHDGVDERIVFDWNYLDSSAAGVFAVIESDGHLVYVDEWIGTPHVGWTSYYLCQFGEKEYLFSYVPYTGTGWGEYRYELMELNSDGQMHVIEQDITEFCLDSAENIKQAWPDYHMDIKDMAVFADNVNELLENSYLLVSTDQDLMDAELNYTDRPFVLGSEERSYRQYEVYHMLGGDLLTLDAKEKPKQGTIYELLKGWCEKEEMPYFKTIHWEVDLNHDGKPETLLFEQKDFHSGDVGRFTVVDHEGQELFSDEIDSNHGTSSTYYLCQWQGKDYLFYYKPYVIMGEGYNRYELFSLDGKGAKVVADSGSVRFHIDHLPSVVNEYGEKTINIPEMVAFADKVNEYINASYLLVCSDNDWIQEIPYEKGQYFVAGSLEEPYRQQETYHWYDDFDVELGQDFGEIKNVADKLKAWCKAAGMPYIE